MNGIAALLVADTVTSPITSIAGAAITLNSSEGTKWAVGDIGHMDGDNDEHVGTVTIVAGDVVTLDQAPASAPGVGDELKQGYVEWARAEAGSELAIYIAPIVGEDPRKALEDPAVGSRCICILELVDGMMAATHRSHVSMALRVTSRNIEYVEGLVRRAGRVLHGLASSLSVSAHDVWELTVSRELGVSLSKPAQTAPGLVEYLVPINAAVSMVV